MKKLGGINLFKPTFGFSHSKSFAMYLCLFQPWPQEMPRIFHNDRNHGNKRQQNIAKHPN